MEVSVCKKLSGINEIKVKRSLICFEIKIYLSKIENFDESHLKNCSKCNKFHDLQ